MPLIIGVLLLMTIVFGAGRSSVDPEVRYEVITKTETKEVRVPGPVQSLPESCRAVVRDGLLLKDASEELSKYAGKSVDIADELGVYAEQARQSQKFVNERLAEARDNRAKIAVAHRDLLLAQIKLDATATTCAIDEKEAR